MEKLIGKLISIDFKYSNENEIISGFLLSTNDKWTLIQHNPVDYQMDGFLLLKTKHIKRHKREKEEKFTEKVIKAKKVKLGIKKAFKSKDLESILKLISKEFGCFILTNKNNEFCYLGSVNKIKGNKLILNYLDTKGKWSEIREYSLNKIRSIEFDTDYTNSLLALGNKKSI